jgi:bacteriorhodopsin
MTDILTLALSVLPFITLVAFPIALVRVLDSTGAPEAARSDLEPPTAARRAQPKPVLDGRPVSARA